MSIMLTCCISAILASQLSAFLGGIIGLVITWHGTFRSMLEAKRARLQTLGPSMATSEILLRDGAFMLGDILFQMLISHTLGSAFFMCVTTLSFTTLLATH